MVLLLLQLQCRALHAVTRPAAAAARFSAAAAATMSSSAARAAIAAVSLPANFVSDERTPGLLRLVMQRARDRVLVQVPALLGEQSLGHLMAAVAGLYEFTAAVDASKDVWVVLATSPQGGGAGGDNVVQFAARPHAQQQGSAVPTEILDVPAPSPDEASRFARCFSHQHFGDEWRAHRVFQYDHAVLGGTFDDIHAGHKVLLTAAAAASRQRVVIGVTSTNMLSKKLLSEFIRPTEERIAHVKEFLKAVRPELTAEAVAITDPVGPAGTDAQLQCIVVSDETKAAVPSINALRQERGLGPLSSLCIPLLPSLSSADRKMSSSEQREVLLGAYLPASAAAASILGFSPFSASQSSPSTTAAMQSQLQLQLQRRRRQRRHPTAGPYLIGLTGGIASGKSAVAKDLQNLGAAVIDCDLLGHRAYVKGTACFDTLVAEFGQDIVGADGEVNRKALGAKVFGAPERLARLNAIVWPAIAGLVKEELAALTARGCEVAVIEAAILLEADWQRMVDEVWVVMVPRDEAKARLMRRNGLTEDQAEQRLASQLTNVERVQAADVVLCSVWERERTIAQGTQAWTLLQQRLASRALLNEIVGVPVEGQLAWLAKCLGAAELGASLNAEALRAADPALAQRVLLTVARDNQVHHATPAVALAGLLCVLERMNLAKAAARLAQLAEAGFVGAERLQEVSQLLVRAAQMPAPGLLTDAEAYFCDLLLQIREERPFESVAPPATGGYRLRQRFPLVSAADT
eukprot:m.130982 g.130982  ORF g.130982 m.130982 type:complete len:748 (-) comp16447_c0_seq2:329-2572(-)